ncbi:esterase family protein [Corynebacterium sp. 3HC-13]|uniref:alpha/beta hydrolase n=1 Tax=Corynebacterium poyangense TaxID=2684405 RepID=UPI001CCEC7FE|nr:alpha/beta hydrolase family protein [Corynebacterium poyangense]MBZ8177601.1 esterase family protein [Corynebacterium poyangense]
MSFVSRFAAPAATVVVTAAAVLGAMGVAPAAAVSTVSAQQVAGATALSTITKNDAPITDDSPFWRKVVNDDDPRTEEVLAYSPAMNRQVPLAILKAEKPNAPTLYLLNGGDGGEGGANWIQQSDVLSFYRDKGFNVVIPMAGKFSYYTDWVEDNENLGGPQKWETFLTKELPGPLENYLHANGNRAIAGMSMSATSSLLLAEHHPGFYGAIGSFSGCAATSTPLPWFYLQQTLQRGKATPEQMWGPMGGEYNVYNDALVNAEKLRGHEIYVSNGSGTAGAWDLPSSPRLANVPEALKGVAMAETIGVGGVIEGATNNCTHNLQAKLNSLGISAQFQFNNTGTHSWGYWNDDLRNFLPVLTRGLGLA